MPQEAKKPHDPPMSRSMMTHFPRKRCVHPSAPFLTIIPEFVNEDSDSKENKGIDFPQPSKAVNSFEFPEMNLDKTMNLSILA